MKIFYKNKSRSNGRAILNLKLRIKKRHAPRPSLTSTKYSFFQLQHAVYQNFRTTKNTSQRSIMKCTEVVQSAAFLCQTSFLVSDCPSLEHGLFEKIPPLYLGRMRTVLLNFSLARIFMKQTNQEN